MACTGAENVSHCGWSDANFASLQLVMEMLNIAVLNIVRLSMNDLVHRRKHLAAVFNRNYVVNWAY